MRGREVGTALHLAVAAPGAGTGRLQMCSSYCLILIQNPTHSSLRAWLRFLPEEYQLPLGLSHIVVPGMPIISTTYLALVIDERLFSVRDCFLVSNNR